MGFTKSDADANLYYIVVGDDPLILVLYVDDLFITRAERLISGCKEDLTMEFEMKDIGLMHYFLGLEVWQEEGHIFLGQLIGSLMYLVNTRRDICFAVNTLSKFMVEPRKVHYVAAKHILRYVLGTVDYGMDYRQGYGVRLASYTNSDWAGYASDMKSTLGCCFRLGSAIVSWFSRKQKSVVLSSSKAEYMDASQASCEAIWLRKLLYGLFDQELRPMVIHYDNQSCIKLMDNPVFHDRSKHIDIRYHFIRDYVQKGVVKLEYISTDEQVADVLMKSLPKRQACPFQGQNGCGEKHFPR
eukprot:PITA_31760